ncbi:TIGR03016 family PEP-CTERM system-associated outer membrane protein [Undibacterium sp. Ren11W]|uniref:TIGR03016 family PEP-CTERM system-associated outer membrane protein n=1 Tax=Undibacterium sp. Ren11W TaxID=3413045 RepID=UPI003BF1CD3D
MDATTAKNFSVFRNVRCSAVFIISIITAANALAADWKFVPTLDFTETFSDNYKLTKTGTEENAFITQIIPGILINATGHRLKFQTTYHLQNTHYSGSNNDSKTDHLLSANANAVLSDDLFFLDANANITQQNLSPFGQVTNNNINLTNNQTEVRTYSVSPYFRRKFDNNFIAELRYTRDSVSSDTQLYSNSKGDSFRANINSGSAFKSVKWGVNYNRQEIDFEKQIPLNTTMTTVNFDYAISSLVKLTSTYGYENNSYFYQGSQASGYFGTLGFAWTPSERTNIMFNTGHRFYGKTNALTISQRARLSVWSLGYNEDVTTTRAEFLIPAGNNTSGFLNQLWQTSIPDPIQRQKVVDSFIRDSALPSSLSQPINTFTNQVFLQKTLLASVAMTGVQNTAILSFFDSSRDPLSKTANSTPLPLTQGIVNQTGMNALWHVQFSPRTNANLNFGYTKSEDLLTGIKDTFKTLRLSLSRQLQPKLNAMLEARHVQKNSNFVQTNYDENAITLYLFLGF